MAQAGPKEITARDGLINESTERAGIEPTLGLTVNRPMRVHVIPQAHIDLIWYWPPSEAVRMILNTFRGHAELLEQNPTYTYCQSQAAAYEVVLQEDPELFERVKNLVARGQWELVGGEWVEADTSLPGPEARIRQLLFGQHFFQEHFGRRAQVWWDPDSFIMKPGSLVQMLCSAGLQYAVYKRPREVYGQLPILPHRWRGPDGSEMLVYRSNNKGNGLPTLSQGTSAPVNQGDLAVIAERFDKAGLADLWGPLGVGDIGGINQYTLPKTDGSFEFAYSTPSSFFARLAENLGHNELPVLEGSLPRIFTGSLTTWAKVKTLNRAAENSLQQTESLLALAHALGMEANVRDLDDPWKRVMYCQFHDSVCGCGTDSVQQLIEHEYQEVIQTAAQVKQRTMRRIAESIKLDPEKGIPVTVFNPLGYQRTDIVEARVTLPVEYLDLVPFDQEITRTHMIDCRSFKPSQPCAMEAVDSEGNCSPVMLLEYAQVQKKFVAVVRFQARRIPPFGYRTWYLRRCPLPDETVQQKNDLQFCTDRLSVVLDRDAGGIAALTFPNGPSFQAHDRPLGQLRLHHTGKYDINYGVEHRAWENGLTGEESILKPVNSEIRKYSGGRLAVAFTYQFGSSNFQQEFLLEPDADFIEVTLSGHWQEVEKYLKVHFAVRSDRELTAFADLPYGITETLPEGRDDVRQAEYPMQYFCGVRDHRQSLLILNNSRYGCMWHDRSLSLSAIRCSTYPAPISDRGDFSLKYRIMGLDVSSPRWQRAAYCAGFGFNIAPCCYGQEYSSNKLPDEWSLLDTPIDDVVATTLKPGHQGDNLVMRLFNPQKNSCRQAISGAPISSSWTPMNLLEDAQGETPNANGQVMAFTPYQLATVAF